MKDLARRLEEPPSWRELRAAAPFYARELEAQIRRDRLRRWLDANSRAMKAAVDELQRVTGPAFERVSDRLERLFRENDELVDALYPPQKEEPAP